MKTVASKNSQNSHVSPDARLRGVPEDTSATTADPSAQAPATPLDGALGVTQPQPPTTTPPGHRYRKWLLLAGTLTALVVGGYFLVPWVDTALNTVSTDDAYVNGHVTFVAPRVPGKVLEVFVDDNNRVKRGDLLVRIDPEPFQVQVNLKRAAVEVATGDLAFAESQARGLEALARSQRWKIQTAAEQVNNQIALLKARAAVLHTKEATLDRARADFERAGRLVPTGAMSREEFDRRRQEIRVAEASVNQAQEEVYQVRSSLGLPRQPEEGKDLTAVPPNLDETYSEVRTALAQLLQTSAQLGRPLTSMTATPRDVLDGFSRLDKDGDIDRIFRKLIPKVPAVIQAKAKLEQARHDLEQAELNLSYCEVRSDIDGTVTRRNVNPGNFVQIGQQLMAVRSLTEIWIDANFKETQLADLRIGQRVKVEVDTYGSHQEFEGRITGFTMGTGQTLALLPPQNATGNFVKIVQRLPVRIELTDYDPDKVPLFVGLSVTPYVYYKELPTGPNAGQVLQPFASLPQSPTERTR
jgi:membrane fusion protein (multidrug efflux system)